jgi:DNA gyrase subunit A
VFISQSGMVQRTAVRGISRYGRLAQGVKLMNMKEDDLVSAVALVVESAAESGGASADGALIESPDQAARAEGGAGDAPADIGSIDDGVADGAADSDDAGSSDSGPADPADAG